MKSNNFPVPFFVVDRPMSLELLRYCEIDKQKGIYGLMGHANTSERFQNLFREFKGDNIVKAADSGVFTKDGCKLHYERLFSIYERMGVEYGIMIDFLKNKDKTLRSAKEALEIYKKKGYSFKLVGVAQGNTVKEYLECYDRLKSLGFDYIAIGGLLKKNINSARYVRVRDENFEVLKEIRSNYKNDWLFLLGCYHPKRHKLFEEFNVFGGDYKGWILNYKTPETLLEDINRELYLFEEKKNVNNPKLKELLQKRKKINKELRKLRKEKKSSKEKEREKLELDKKILNLRKKLAKEMGDEYCLKLQTFEKILFMDKKTAREFRFRQLKAYLENNIFSLFRDYLLIISCSERKTQISNPAPAIELYDGPFFKMIRKLKNECVFPNNIHVLVISAKYGVLGLYDLIERYDKKMTEKRAKELKNRMKEKLGEFLSNKNFKEIFLCMGKNYRLVLDDFEPDIPIIYADGKIGEKLSQMREWIYSKCQS